MEAEAEGDQNSAPPSRVRHINKRSLRNKSISITFDEKDLRNYVTGFHKRKKKRRKEALKQQEEALRRKRIEQRKKRKQERDYAIYGGASPRTDSVAEGSDDDSNDDEDGDKIPSVSGTTMYDNGDLKVTVTTSEISRDDEEIFPIQKAERVLAERPEPNTNERKQKLPVSKKKTFKRVSRQKSKPKSQNRKDKKKGNKKGKGR